MKIKIFILCLSIAVFVRNSYGQNQKVIDSLLQVLKTAKEDTNKVNTLNALGKMLSNSNPDTSIILANQALSISEKTASKKHIANSYHVIALGKQSKGNYPSSLENNFKALSLREEIADQSEIAKSLGNIGSIYMFQGNYPKALDYFFRGLKIQEKLGNRNGAAIDLGNIGIVYSDQGDYPKALDYYFKSLKIKEELGNKNGIATDMVNIGVVYYKQKDYPKALDVYFKALKMVEQLGNKYENAVILANIGIVYKNQGNYPKALDYYFKALKIDKELGDKNGIAFDIGSIGVLYIETGKFTEAEMYLKKAIAMNDSIGAMEEVWRFEESLSQLYDHTGRYKLALQHYKRSMTVKDTLFNQEKNKEITRKEMNYEFEKIQAAEKTKHEKQLAVADVEVKKQKLLKNSFIGGLALTILLFFFGYRFYHAEQVLRLQTIRNKISGDLHDDIGSTLNSISIYSEVAKKKDTQQDEALEMIGDASRKIIDAMSDIVWTINPENDSFDKIIFRMKSLAYNLFRAKQIEYTFQSDDILNEKKLSIEDRRNIYLIFKEAVNNLVKYSNATRAAITLTNEIDYIKLRIQDDGVGFDTSQEMEGNGLKSMKRRADEMKAQFKLESGKENGTMIELILKA